MSRSLFYIIIALSICLFRATSIQLSSNPQITLTYSFPKNDTIRFTLESYTQGYVGLGFGTQMAGTNIILSYMQAGTYIVKDTTASGHFKPTDNAVQNVLGISGSRDSTKSIYVFERLLNTGNSNDYTIVPFQSTPIIWAYGSSDSLSVHVAAGMTNIVFNQCDTSCLTCTGPLASNCDSCDTNHSLINGSCVSSLVTCNSSCATCSGSSDNCTSCASGKYLTANGSCISCSSFCANCSGPSYLQCLSCPTGSILNKDGGCILNYRSCPDLNGFSCFSIQLKSNPIINLNYSFTNSSSINIAMEYYTQGFIAMGFGFNMTLADIILANMTNGLIGITDRTIWKHGVPVIDAVQHSQLIAGSRTGEKTIAIFQRGLNLNATNKTVITPMQTQPLIFSYGGSDAVQYHGATNRSAVMVSFITCHNSCISCFGPEINQCSSCAQNFTLINGYCASSQCSKNCQLCSSFECLQCDTTIAYLLAGICVLNNTNWNGWESVTLNQNPLLRLNYSFPTSDTINLVMEYYTQGFIGLGFGYNMSKADIILAYVQNGQFTVIDAQSSKHGIPTNDSSQDLIAMYCFRDSTKTVSFVQRKLQTSDTTDYKIIVNNTTPLIWAHGTSDTLQYHGTRRGQTNVIFLQTKVGGICDESCDTCFGPMPDQCILCSTHYFFNDNECNECDVSCLNCSGNSPNQCLSCSNGFILVNGTCQKPQITCSNHCISCNVSETCLQCNENYTLQNGICIINSSNSSNELNKISSIKINTSPLIFLNYTFPSQDIIELMMEFHTTGYVSIGFGAQMSGADMIFASMQNGQMTVKSLTAAGHSMPTENSVQNLILKSFSRDTEKTIVIFQRNLTYQRLLTTGTSGLYSITPNSNIPLIWSYGQSDTLEYHLNRGNQVVQFQQINCDPSCLTCSGAASTECLSCNSSLILQNGSCIQVSCDSTCQTCSGPSNNQCTSCLTGFSLINGLCVNSSSTNNSTSNNSDLLSDLTSTLKVTDQFYLLWKFNSDNTITMGFKWKTGGFIALGFGTSMGGMDVISAETINGQLNVFDRWASSPALPNLDSDLGGKNDLTLLASLNSDSQGFSIVKFKRALNTGDMHDYVIKQQNEKFCFAFSSQSTISYHGSNVFFFSFDFVEGLNGQAMVEQIEKPKLIQAHGIGLLIVWSFLVDVSLIIVRYFKNFKNYIEIHASLFFILDIFTFIIVFLVIGKNGDSLEWKFKNDKAITAHFALGVIVLNLIVVQHLFGFFMKKAMGTKKLNALSSNLHKIKRAHRFLGYSIYLITKASVLSGIWVYDYRELFIGFCIYFGFLLLFRAAAEIYYQKAFQKKVTDLKSPVKFRNNFEELIKDLEIHEIPFTKIAKKYPKLKWCLLNNSVYDLGKFEHPGGQFIIEQINGREVGRYFFGAYSLEHTNIRPYTHTMNAKQLLDQRHVGEIRLDELNVLQMIPTQKPNSLWNIVEKKKITQSISKFEFSSNGYLVKNHISGVEWFGRHFTVHCPNGQNKKVRLYTTVISFTDANQSLRKDLIAFFEQKMGKKLTIEFSETFQLSIRQDSLKQLAVQSPPPTSQNLPLIIKRYDYLDTFSHFVHHSSDETFSIDGPHGPGLELTRNSNGHHVIFCGGTGILPFVDLLNFLLHKSIYHVLFTMFGKEAAEQANVYMEDYEGTLGSKFKVILYASFQSKEEIEYLDFILTLYNINKSFNLNYFDMILRFSDEFKIPGIPTTQSYFDDKFFNDNIIPDQCNKIFICGNPKMNKLIPEICLRNQIEKEKIYLV